MNLRLFIRTHIACRSLIGGDPQQRTRGLCPIFLRQRRRLALLRSRPGRHLSSRRHLRLWVASMPRAARSRSSQARRSGRKLALDPATVAPIARDEVAMIRFDSQLYAHFMGGPVMSAGRSRPGAGWHTSLSVTERKFLWVRSAPSRHWRRLTFWRLFRSKTNY